MQAENSGQVVKVRDQSALSRSEVTAAKAEPSEFEKGMARRDFALKLVATILTFVGLSISAVTFFHQRDQELRQQQAALAAQKVEADRAEQSRKREIQAAFFTQRLSYYMAVSDAVGQVAALSDPVFIGQMTADNVEDSAESNEYWKKLNDSYLRFSQLYWGPMCVVEDKEVETSMIHMSALLSAALGRDFFKEGPSREPQDMLRALYKIRGESVILSNVLRHSMEQIYQLNLTPAERLEANAKYKFVGAFAKAPAPPGPPPPIPDSKDGEKK